jgi:hypothetical protein
MDDAIFEGPHSATVQLAVRSNDTNYNNIGVSPISINIADNDCPPITAPANARLVACSNTYGRTCTVACDEGHAPSTPLLVTCKTDATWDKPTLPSCASCLPGRWKNPTGKCRNCTDALCPTGMYRTRCSEQSDGVCVPCTAPLPADALYSGPGQPHDTDTCPWICKPGFTRVPGQDACDPIPQSVEVIVSDTSSLTTQEGTPLREPASFLVRLSMQPTAPITVRGCRCRCI